MALIGARQCGKTTLARQFVAADSPNYFDLEDPLSLARLDEPMTALGPLSGLVVIDEVQRRPDLFPVLRVLADRERNPARFLVLGSAGPELLRQSAESLAGRIEYLELVGLQVAEVGAENMEALWLRGGLPRSLLADSDENSLAWRKSYMQSFVELDLLLFMRGRRIGVEIKRIDAPRRTPSMTAALRDLSLDALWVLYPGRLRYPISEHITAIPADEPFPADAAAQDAC